jgi:hypothetical protein
MDMNVSQLSKMRINHAMSTKLWIALLRKPGIKQRRGFLRRDNSDSIYSFVQKIDSLIVERTVINRYKAEVSRGMSRQRNRAEGRLVRKATPSQKENLVRRLCGTGVEPKKTSRAFHLAAPDCREC